MRVLCMPQAFKGSLHALHAAAAMAEGVRRVLPEAEAHAVPMADGGDDTLDVLIGATGGRYLSTEVTGPSGLLTRARWGVLGDGQTAVVEMAEASGIRLLLPHQRDPLNTTTAGTGQLIQAALDAGCRKIIVGVGGSATVDAGTGAAKALGARFLDSSGSELPSGGAALARLARIDLASLDPRVHECSIRVACDVNIPLCGARGAWRFAAQKGATPEGGRELAKALEWFGGMVAESLGVDLRSMPLAGPAGGLSGGLHAFLGAQLVAGPDLVLEATGIGQHVLEADLVITGEGKMDGTTFWGKGPGVVAAQARRAGVPVLAVVGQLGEDTPDLPSLGFLEVETLMRHAASEEEALACAERLVTIATQEALRRYVRSEAATRLR